MCIRDSTANVGWRNLQGVDGMLAFSFWCAGNDDVRLVFTTTLGRSTETSSSTDSSNDWEYVSDVIGSRAELESKWTHVAIQVNNYDLGGTDNIGVRMYANGEVVYAQTFDCESTGTARSRRTHFYHDQNNSVNYATFLRFGHCHMPFGYGNQSPSTLMNDDYHAVIRSHCKLYNIAFFDQDLSEG